MDNENCENIYLKSIYVKKCNASNTVFISGTGFQPFDIWCKISTFKKFLKLCINYRTSYQMKFFYYPSVTVIKRGKILEKFKIENITIYKQDFFNLYHFLNK